MPLPTPEIVEFYRKLAGLGYNPFITNPYLNNMSEKPANNRYKTHQRPSVQPVDPPPSGLVSQTQSSQTQPSQNSTPSVSEQIMNGEAWQSYIQERQAFVARLQENDQPKTPTAPVAAVDNAAGTPAARPPPVASVTAPPKVSNPYSNRGTKRPSEESCDAAPRNKVPRITSTNPVPPRVGRNPYMAGYNININATAHVPNNLIRDIVNDVVTETTFAVIKAIVEKNIFDAGL